MSGWIVEWTAKGPLKGQRAALLDYPAFTPADIFARSYRVKPKGQGEIFWEKSCCRIISPEEQLLEKKQPPLAKGDVVHLKIELLKVKENQGGRVVCRDEDGDTVVYSETQLRRSTPGTRAAASLPPQAFSEDD